MTKKSYNKPLLEKRVKLDEVTAAKKVEIASDLADFER